MTVWPSCADCGETVISQGAHLEACVGPRPLTIQLARKIVDGQAFHDLDAIRVAQAYLELTSARTARGATATYKVGLKAHTIYNTDEA